MAKYQDILIFCHTPKMKLWSEVFVNQENYYNKIKMHKSCQEMPFI